MHQPDFYFEQLVTEAFMDLVFSWAETADLQIRQDILNPLNGSGDPRGAIHRGGDVLPTAAPSLAVRSSACYATDPDGRRVHWPTEQTVDCSLDYLGVSTEVESATDERYIGIFAEFDRELTDQKIDGNGNLVYSKQFESYAIKVFAGSEETIGSALPPATPSGAIRLANVHLVYGQTQILTADIEYDTVGYERDDWIRIVGTDLGEFTQGIPSEAIEQLFAWLDDVSGGGSTFTSTANWHDGSSLASVVMNSAVNEIVSDLASTSGADRIGASAFLSSNNLADLAEGSAMDQLHELSEYIDGHADGGSLKHDASDVVFDPAASFLTSVDTQSAIDELIAELASTDGFPGAVRIGIDEIGGSPFSLADQPVQNALSAIVANINLRPRKASDETITGSYTFENIIELAANQGVIGAKQTTDGYTEVIRPIDSGGIGSTRIYVGFQEDIWIVRNATWSTDDDRWEAEITTNNSYAMQVGLSGIHFHHKDKEDPEHGAGTGWTSWTSSVAHMTWTGSGTAVEAFERASGDFYDKVRFGVGGLVETGGDDWEGYASVTWHKSIVDVAGGSDLTLSVRDSKDFVGSSIQYADATGADIYMGFTQATTGLNVYWYGTIEVDTTT